MWKQTNKQLRLTNNQLKIIAMVSMVLDHVGLALFPYVEIFRVLGRLAFPIFAYMIAEGCAHTRNRKKHLLTISSMAFLFQLVYLIFMNDLYQGILVTFSLSIGIIYSLEGIIQNKNTMHRAIMLLALTFYLFYGIVCPILFGKYGFEIDYKGWGIFLPVIIYFAPNKKAKLLSCATILAVMSLFSLPRQWFALLTIPLLALYNGERGKAKMKYFFYIAYPLHLVIIYGILILLTIIK